MHLKQRAPRVVIVWYIFASQLVVLFLDVRQVFLRVGQIDVPVELDHLQLTNLVLRLLHHVRIAWADSQV